MAQFGAFGNINQSIVAWKEIFESTLFYASNKLFVYTAIKIIYTFRLLWAVYGNGSTILSTPALVLFKSDVFCVDVSAIFTLSVGELPPFSAYEDWDGEFGIDEGKRVSWIDDIGCFLGTTSTDVINGMALRCFGLSRSASSRVALVISEALALGDRLRPLFACSAVIGRADDDLLYISSESLDHALDDCAGLVKTSDEPVLLIVEESSLLLPNLLPLSFRNIPNLFLLICGTSRSADKSVEGACDLLLLSNEVLGGVAETGGDCPTGLTFTGRGGDDFLDLPNTVLTDSFAHPILFLT